MKMTEDKLRSLMTDLESESVERTRAFDKADKMGQAICAFASDLSGSGEPGYLLLGVENDGTVSGKRIDDEHLTSLGGLKTEGNLLPPPAMALEVFHLAEGDVVVITVFPSVYPPIRYKGQAWIRVSARKALATDEDIHVLEEKRQKSGIRFEEQPCLAARMDDMDLDLFRTQYLPRAIRSEIIEEDSRPVQEQLAALRFFNRETKTPTNLGMILFGKHPDLFIPSAYLQYVKFNSADNGGDILAEHAYKGPLLKTIDELNGFVKVGVAAPHPVRISTLQEKTFYSYPDWSLRELLLNAIIHRDYQIGNAPIKFYDYNGLRIEISNPGGLYGQARPDNFPFVNDYRNPLLAEAMKVMGYVNKFNRGIAKVKTELQENGNPPPVFDYNKRTEFRVTLCVSDLSVSPRQGTQNKAGDATNDAINGANKAGDAINDAIKGANKAGDAINDAINDDARVLAAIERYPGIKKRKLKEATGLSLRAVERIVKKMSSDSNRKIEYRGSKKTGGWFIKS